MKSASHCILITRPYGQEENLAQQCRALGLIVKHMPCLQIQPVDAVTMLKKAIGESSAVLFTSANAVQHAHEQYPLPWPDLKVYAIGSATAAALQTRGQAVELPPEPPFNSEAFLAQTDNLTACALTIIKGCGGRDLIAQSLRAKGWQPKTVDVYQRALPVIDKQAVSAIFKHRCPDIISITSNEALQNLMTLTAAYKHTVLGIPLLVNSIRCRELATTLGFRSQALVANPAGDDGQLEQLKHWLTTRA